jgi:two-component system, NarL family, sensor histidine kinase DesK
VSPSPGFGRNFRYYLRGNTHGRSRAFPALVWLGFILFPLVDAITTHASPVAKALTIVGATAFVASYLALVLMWRQRPWRVPAVALFGVLLGCAIALTLASGPGWAFLFTYCTAVVALFSSADVGWLWVVGCASLAALCSGIAGASGGAVVTYGVTALGIGLLMVLMRDLRVRNEELSAARAELADAAVAQERERFARDLHDLLGHSLSVIALKAELAGRLLPARPEQAATEVGEVEQVARQALSEVRLAVSGYRQPTLEGELAGARMALAAAGIEAEVNVPKVTLQPDVEAVLAWAIREGATNVIRHSRAGRATIRVTAGLAGASVEVVDDGARGDRRRGAEAGDAAADVPSAGGRHAGHGLDGLRERAAAIDGRVEAGPLPDGGFRLMVSVPVPRGSGSASSAVVDRSALAGDSGPDARAGASGQDSPAAQASGQGGQPAAPGKSADAAAPGQGGQPASPRAPHPVSRASK